MRHVLLAALLVVVIATPTTAAPSTTLTTLPVKGSPSGGLLNGSITLGGVSGTITSTGSSSMGTWTMTVHGLTFATGTYTCSGGACTYTGTLVGSTTTFSFSTGNLSAGATGFATHGAWVSGVAHWANENRAALAGVGVTVGDIVSGAAKIEGPLASADHIPNQSSRGEGHGGSHGGR